jgi:hypothetical protein
VERHCVQGLDSIQHLLALCHIFHFLSATIAWFGPEQDMKKVTTDNKVQIAGIAFINCNMQQVGKQEVVQDKLSWMLHQAFPQTVSLCSIIFF